MRGVRIQSKKAMGNFLFEGMRMDFFDLATFNFDILDQIIELEKGKPI